MPQYVLRDIEHPTEIINAGGNFGPNATFMATHIAEVFTVFETVEWFIFTDESDESVQASLDNNPFVYEWALTFAKTPTQFKIVVLGSLANMVIHRATAYAILKAKYGLDAQDYIKMAEHQESWEYWSMFVVDNKFDRMALIDDYETYLISKEV